MGDARSVIKLNSDWLLIKLDCSRYDWCCVFVRGTSLLIRARLQVDGSVVCKSRYN